MTTMDAVVQSRYGDADVLRVARVPIPEPARGEVRLRVVAASINRGDVHLMEGRPLMLRLFMGRTGPRQQTRGMDVAGIVDAVGESVTAFAEGDEVFGVAEGSFAQYALAQPSKLAHKPTSVSFEQAAASPVAGCAALKGLRDAGRLQAGQRVLITGAAGGVGVFAVQIAASMGAHVTGVCSAAKSAAVLRLGADEAIDYATQDFSRAGRQWDLIFDAAGHRSLTDLRRSLTPTGTAVIVGSETEAPFLGGFDRTIRAGMLSPLVRQRLVGLTSLERTADLEELGRLMASGAITPAIDRTVSLGETADGVRQLQDGRVVGKVVVVV
jgi:NADPH:quinone reductase-like Zn-dependent oxidoreductase